MIPRSKPWGAARDQSHCKNNGGVVCIDESLPSTLCRFNVIPVTSAMTTGTESGFQHHFRGGGWMVLQLLMEALSFAASSSSSPRLQFTTIYLIGSSKSTRLMRRDEKASVLCVYGVIKRGVRNYQCAKMRNLSKVFLRDWTCFE